MPAPGQEPHFKRDADKLQSNQDNKGSGNHIIELKKLTMKKEYSERNIISILNFRSCNKEKGLGLYQFS